jgi:hypothetical protein
MNSTHKLGYWCALSLTIIFIIWTACFLGIAFSSPLFFWTNLNDYLLYIRTNNQIFANVAGVAMLLFGPLFVILVQCFYDAAIPSSKPYVRISLLFALAFAIVSCLHYFVQLTSVRILLEDNHPLGLELFVQANPYSIMTSVDMLGWTFFLGITSFFLVPVFKQNSWNRSILIYFLILGISCTLAGLGYAFQIVWLTFLFVNIGVGGSLFAISLTTVKFFRGHISKSYN